MKCTFCEDSRWVCQRHPDKPWGRSKCLPVRRGWDALTPVQFNAGWRATRDTGGPQDRGQLARLGTSAGALAWQLPPIT
jgi:hypothetical protein